MELNKIGGKLWTNGIVVPERIAAPATATRAAIHNGIHLDAAADFLKDAKNIKSSTSVDKMLALKREKKQRQFMGDSKGW
jgi:hypothetical protein